MLITLVDLVHQVVETFFVNYSWRPFATHIAILAAIAITTRFVQTTLSLQLLINFSNVITHKRLVVQLFLMATLSTLHRALMLAARLRSPWWDVLIMHADLIFSALVFLIVGTLPRGPEKRIDITNLYNTAVRKAMISYHGPGSAPAAAISPEYECSLLVYLTSAWCIPAVRESIRQEQVDVQDLPSVPSHLRMHNITQSAVENDLTLDTTSSLKTTSTQAFLWRMWANYRMTMLQSELC